MELFVGFVAGVLFSAVAVVAVIGWLGAALDRAEREVGEE